MNILNKILEYFRLFRFHAVSMETTIILIGALIMGQNDLFLLLIIFIIGVFGHICGYVLNDYADIEVDKESLELKKKPLVSGAIPRKNALIIAFFSGAFTYIFTIVFFPNLRSIFLLLIATILTIVYNFYGKKIIGSDFIVAGTVSVFFLFGASTISTPFTNLTYIVCLIFFFDIVFINVVEGGLKDVDHDFKSGAKTLATIMGVKVQDDILKVNKNFQLFAYILRFIYIILILLLGFESRINLWLSDRYLIQILTIIFIIIILYGSYKFLNIKIFDRSKMKKLYSGINASTAIILIIILSHILSIEVVIFLLVFPVTWYTIFNKILYGKLLQPRV
jgi:4-hydroxybenzoate polyprenyltransferase